MRSNVLDEKREELNDMLVYSLGRKENVYVLSLLGTAISSCLEEEEELKML